MRHNPNMRRFSTAFGGSLRGLSVRGLKCANVLLLQAGVVNVATPCRSRPHPALGRAARELPAGFQNEANARCEIQHQAGCFRLAVSDEQRAIGAVGPSDVLPSQPIALIW